MFASLAIFWLLTDLTDGQTSLTATSASVDGETLTITLSAEVDVSGVADASDFSVTVGGSAVSVESVEVGGTTITLTLADGVGDPDCDSSAVAVSYVRSGSSISVSGTELSDFSGLSVANDTDAAPEIVSIETDVTGQYIYVTFCEGIAAGEQGWLTIAAFEVRISNSSAPIQDVVLSSSHPERLEIEFGSPEIAEGETVRVTYDQSLAEDGDPPQDADQGNKLVDSWSALTVTNRVDSPPALVSVTALWDVITLTYSESLDPASMPDKSAFMLSGRNSPPQVESVAISGNTVTLAMSAVIQGELSPEYQLAYTPPSESPLQQADGAQQAEEIFSQTVISSTPTTNPEVQGATVNGATLEIEFDHPLKNVAPASAFTIGGQDGVSVTAASFSGTVVTLTLSPAVTAGSTITVSYVKPNPPPRVEARNNRNADSFTDRAVVNSTVAPTPVLSGARISADGTVLTLTFSLELDSSSAGTPGTATFSLGGTDAAVGSVSVDGTTVTLALDPPADAGESVTVTYAPPSDATQPRLRSLAHSQAAAAFDMEAVTNQADGKPRPTAATVDGSALVVRFDRALDAASIPAASAFTLSGSSATVTGAAILGRELTLTLSASVTHLETLTLSYAAPGASPLKRAGRELNVDGFTGLMVENLAVDPTPMFESASIDADGRTLTIVMSEELLGGAAGTPAGSSFRLGGTTSASVASVAIVGATVLLSLDPAADLNETAMVSYEPPTDASLPALQSVDGDWKTAGWSGRPVTNGADGVPRAVSAVANAGTITLGFDRALDGSSIPPAADFVVAPAGHAVSLVAIGGASVTLTLASPVAFGEAVTVSYSAAGMTTLRRDGLALDVAAFSGLEADNQTPEPLVRSVVGEGNGIVIAFSQALNTGLTPAAGAFSLSGDGPTVDGVTVNAMSVGLSLDASLTEGAEYTLTYSKPSDSALETSDGSPVASFTEAVANVTDVAPTVLSVVGDGATVTVTFDQPLDSMASVEGGWFSLSGDAERTVTAVESAGSALTLTLSTALSEGEAASLTYTQPERDGIVDPTGHRTASFSEAIENRTDTAPAPVSGTVVDAEIVILLDQDIYDDPRFHDDDGYPTEHFTVSGIDAFTTIDFVQVSNDGPGGVGKIVITLSANVGPDDAVSVRYFPDSGTIRIREDEADERRAEINGYVLQNLTPARAESATVDGATLIVTFDHALDDCMLPQASDFAVRVDDAPATVASAGIQDGELALTLSESVIEDATVVLAHAASESSPLLGMNGGAAESFEMLTVENLTDYAPFVVEVWTDEEGTNVFVRFDQRLAPLRTIEREWFDIVQEGLPELEIRTVVRDPDVGDDTQLLIELEDAELIREGADVTLEYRAPDSGGLQDDDAPNRVLSFIEVVDNRVDVEPRVERVMVNGNVLTVNFDQPLDPESVPPASCEKLRQEDSQVDCQEPEEFTWFTVVRDEEEIIPIESVVVSGVTVVLELGERVGKGETVKIRYEGKSYDGDGRNLRDVASPGHPVNDFTIPSPDYPGIETENVTPARATGALLNRDEADTLRVEFDHDLDSAAAVDLSTFTVTADGSAVGVQSVSASGTELSILLTTGIPECAIVAVGYELGDPPLVDLDGRLVDSDGRLIEAFRFDVANLIDPELGLACVAWDGGAMALSFGADSQTPDGLESELTLRVEGGAREFSLEASDGVVRLIPAAPICLGEVAQVVWTRPDPADERSWTRTIERAAPCAVSAVAEGTELRVAFDQALDPALPSASDFMLDGEASVAAVVSIEGATLVLRLGSAGIDAGQEVDLTYSGSSLIGGGLTVAPFTIPVSNRTEPPRFVSGFGVGELIALTFDQPLLSRSVPASRFILAGFDEEPKISRVEISGTSVYLHLASKLPDEPDLFGVVYLAKASGGLAGVSGARLGNGVFVVDNYTETPPGIAAAEADRRTLDVRFDQRVDGREATVADFVVYAGRRRLDVTEMTWSKQGVVLTISERVTSPDAVRLTYAPSGESRVRDLSGNELAALEFWADNVTKAPKAMAALVEEAKLRSQGGTTFARELVRGVAEGDGIRVTILPGIGTTNVAYRAELLSVDAAGLRDGPVTVRWSRLEDASALLAELEHVPSWCWDADHPDAVMAWWLGESDPHGVPTDRGVAVSVTGAVGAGVRGVDCVLDLVSGAWRFWRRGDVLTSPALILSREAGTGFRSDPWLSSGSLRRR